MTAYAERERIALAAAAQGPRPTGRRLTRAELDRLVLHRLFPRLAALLEASRG